MIFLARLYFLQELASFAAVLPNKASSVSHEELSILITELSSSDVSVVLLIMQLGEYFFEGSRDQVVDSDVVGCKEEDRVAVGTNSEVKDRVKFVNLPGFLF